MEKGLRAVTAGVAPAAGGPEPDAESTTINDRAGFEPGAAVADGSDAEAASSSSDAARSNQTLPVPAGAGRRETRPVSLAADSSHSAGRWLPTPPVLGSPARVDGFASGRVSKDTCSAGWASPEGKAEGPGVRKEAGDESSSNISSSRASTSPASILFFSAASATDEASWITSKTAIWGTPKIAATRAASVAARDLTSAGRLGNERAKASLSPLPPNFGSASSAAKAARASSGRPAGPRGAGDVIRSCDAHTQARDTGISVWVGTHTDRTMACGGCVCAGGQARPRNGQAVSPGGNT